MAGFIPAVEIAHHKHRRGVGRPNSEMSAAAAIVVDDMRAEFAGEAKMAALVKEVKIVIGRGGLRFHDCPSILVTFLVYFRGRGGDADMSAGEHC